MSLHPELQRVVDALSDEDRDLFYRERKPSIPWHERSDEWQALIREVDRRFTRALRSQEMQRQSRTFAAGFAAGALLTARIGAAARHADDNHQ